MSGTRVDGKYELSKVLGQGAMGVVYRARHATTGREVALKLLHPGKALAPQALERFQREARAMGTVADSPHAVQVLDAGLDPSTGAPYIVMELLSGEDVEALLSRLGPLPVPLALRIVAQALTGLLPAHDKAIVHRDLKPSNLYLMRRPEADPIVKVLDFGIAKMRAEGEGKLTATDSTLGSPAYMSPEQVRADQALDVRSDLWSMGVVLYQLVAGALPFEADQLHAMLLAILNGAPVPLAQRAPWVSPEVSAIVERAMQRDPAKRFSSAREMRDAVLRALGAAPGSTAPAAAAISDAMVIPLSAAERSSRPSMSGMAVSVAGARATGVSGVGGTTAMAAVMPASAGPQQTQPLSALPSSAAAGPATAVSAAPPTGTAQVIVPSIAPVIGRVDAVSATEAASAHAGSAAPPFAHPTQASAGVVPAGGGGTRVFVAIGVGVVLVLGAAAIAAFSRSTTQAPSGTTAGPATASTTLADDAGASAPSRLAPDASPEDSPDAGAPPGGAGATPMGATVKPRQGTSPNSPTNNADPFKGKRTGK